MQRNYHYHCLNHHQAPGAIAPQYRIPATDVQFFQFVFVLRLVKMFFVRCFQSCKRCIKNRRKKRKKIARDISFFSPGGSSSACCGSSVPFFGSGLLLICVYYKNSFQNNFFSSGSCNEGGMLSEENESCLKQKTATIYIL